MRAKRKSAAKAKPQAAATPSAFQIIFSVHQNGAVVVGFNGPSYATFDSQASAAHWFRGVADSIALTIPSIRA